MIEVPPEVLAAFGVSARETVERGDVFLLRSPWAYYLGSTKTRPGVVVRVAVTSDGEPVRAWLLYTTTERVPSEYAIAMGGGEGGLDRDCRIDVRGYKEIDVASLLSDCPKLGRLATHRVEKIESMIHLSQLSARVRDLG